jgi:RecA/RadA recombinase
MISTGSRALDSLLGGGLRKGMITDVFGESGSGKTQLCFTAAVNCAQSGGSVIFVDTAGTFRPERIMEIGGSQAVLESITYLRAISTKDQTDAGHKIHELCPALVVIDGVASLFSVEYSGPQRHLAVMRHLHDLAVSAVRSGCTILVTNMIRNVPSKVTGIGASTALQREYLGSSVSIYSHIKLKLEIVDASRSIFRARLIQPPAAETAAYSISMRGICDAVGTPA